MSGRIRGETRPSNFFPSPLPKRTKREQKKAQKTQRFPKDWLG